MIDIWVWLIYLGLDKLKVKDSFNIEYWALIRWMLYRIMENKQMEPFKKNLVRVPPVMSSNGLESTTLGKTRVDKVVVVSWKYILSNWCFLEVFSWNHLR